MLANTGIIRVGRMMTEKDLDLSQKLVEAAREAREKAYAPYSHYSVGAALLANDGTVYTGCNIENAAYPATVCAERVALFKAVSEGVKDFKSIAIVTRNGGSPCGICRQALNEFAPNLKVILADMDRITAEYTLDELLPAGFSPQHLD